MAVLSPRINKLLQEMQSEGQPALAPFWREASQHGAPLIERIADDEQHVLVTFLWRASEATENVVVIGQLGTGQDFAENCMQRLLDTDLWYKTYQLRSDLRAAYTLSPNDSLMPYHKVEDWLERTKTWQPDPLNPNQMVVPEHAKPLSTFELPDAPPQPWLITGAHVPTGRVDETRFRSNILGNERTVWVYTPPEYGSDQAPHNLLILFDGAAYLRVMHVVNTLDNLHAHGRLPPLIALLVDNIDFATRAVELGCNALCATFVVDELLPWIRKHYHVSSDPSHTVVGGFSLGGLAAAYLGFTHADSFGKVLSQSGSFWWKPADYVEHEWLTRQFVLAEKRPLTLYLDVGVLETESTYDNGPSMVVVNRHMRDVLEAKGYSVHYREYAGGHDYMYWRGALADGLLALV
ncbi:MAG: enterochelin esterase [Caldilineaceae bacterium]